MNDFSYHILILNEDPIDSADYQSVLLNYGFQVSCFHDSTTAFTEMNSGKYDVAVIDYNAIDTNERQVLRQLKEYVNPMKVRIIFLTTLNQEVFYKICTLKSVYYIQKPISINELVVRLEVLLKQKDQLKQYKKESVKNDKIILENQREIDDLKKISQILEQFKQDQSDKPMQQIDRICYIYNY